MNRQLVAAFVFTLVVESFCKDCTRQSCNTDLFNEKVVKAETYTRPLSGSSSEKKGIPPNWGLHHAGVVVTLSNGDKYLIHKGKGYGRTDSSPSTVITDAGYMSSQWRKVDSVDVRGLTVNDYMHAAKINEPYRLIRGPNCQTAAREMSKLSRKNEKKDNH